MKRISLNGRVINYIRSVNRKKFLNLGEDVFRSVNLNKDKKKRNHKPS